MAGTGKLQMMMIWALDREVAGGELWVARRKEVYRSLEDWRSTFRLGHVENARRHLFLPGRPAARSIRASEVAFFGEAFEPMCWCPKNWWLEKCTKGMWWANAGGTDSSPQLISWRVEALLKLYQIEDADSCLSSIPKFEHYFPSCSTKFFGVIAEAYVLYVRAQVEMALGSCGSREGGVDWL